MLISTISLKHFLLCHSLSILEIWQGSASKNLWVLATLSASLHHVEPAILINVNVSNDAIEDCKESIVCPLTIEPFNHYYTTS